eukprot:scaffold1295_cov15-Tisochrysis_lutea.AAC.1
MTHAVCQFGAGGGHSGLMQSDFEMKPCRGHLGLQQSLRSLQKQRVFGQSDRLLASVAAAGVQKVCMGCRVCMGLLPSSYFLLSVPVSNVAIETALELTCALGVWCVDLATAAPLWRHMDCVMCNADQI